ncbi:unnamed protein product [Calypogeia fissa]
MALTELYLGENDMGRRKQWLTPADEELMELAGVLENRKLPKLQMLDLEHSVGGTREVAKAFTDAVRSNNSLVLTFKVNWPSFSAYESHLGRYLVHNRRIQASKDGNLQRVCPAPVKPNTLIGITTIMATIPLKVSQSVVLVGL